MCSQKGPAYILIKLGECQLARSNRRLLVLSQKVLSNCLYKPNVPFMVADQDQASPNVVYDQGLYLLLAECSILKYIFKKNTIQP